MPVVPPARIDYNLRAGQHTRAADPAMNDLRANSAGDPVGLCRICAWARVITSSKGSVFYLCRLGEHDARFPRYPRLPVNACAGYLAAGESKGTTKAEYHSDEE